MATNDTEESHFQFLQNKYHIVETKYSESDLTELEEKVRSLFDENADWNEKWMNKDNMTLFLRFYGSVKKALSHFESYCSWRHVEKIDEISIEDQGLQKELQVGRCTIIETMTDKCGRPVVIVNIRVHNKNETNAKTIDTFLYYTMELISRMSAKNIHQSYLCVFDLKGFSLQNMDYKLAKQIIFVLQNYYVERLGTALFINYPWIFHGCWKLIRVLLSETTKSKFIFASKEETNDFVDLEKLPVKLFE